MDEHRVRHLPVVTDGRLVGMVSAVVLTIAAVTKVLRRAGVTMGAFAAQALTVARTLGFAPEITNVSGGAPAAERSGGRGAAS